MPAVDLAALARVPEEARDAIDGVHEASWATNDPVLLELARLRIAMLLGSESELSRRTPEAIEAGLDEEKLAALAQWPGNPAFSALEQAALALTEQFVIDVANVTPAQIDALSAHLDPAQVYAFVTGLLALDGYQRLLLTLEGLAGSESA